jgi:hypothetical protein
VAVRGETLLAADAGEPLAISVGGEARMTGGGNIGTSGAVGGGGDPLAVDRADNAPGPAGSLHQRLRPLQ